MSQILDKVADCIFRVDSTLKIKYVSNNGIRWLGGNTPETPKLLSDIIFKDDFHIYQDSCLGAPEEFSCVVRLMKENKETWCNLKGYLMPDAKQYIVCVIDISKWKNDADGLIYAAEHDSLTQLANRVLLEKIITKHIKAGDVSFSIALLDLDGFKKVNDTHGHLAGDAVLVETAKRLVKTAGKENTVVRLGGDEFVVFISDPKGLDQNNNVMKRILQIISRPYEYDGHELYIGASIGIAHYPDHGENYTVLLKNADIAMYRSKTTGKNRITTYNTSIETEDLSIEAALHRAIHEGEFYLEYQLLFDLDRKVLGAEALMRWNSTLFGVVSPDKFIPIAEDSGLMAYLGKWALRCACWQLKEFQQIIPNFTMSINVSSIQFKDNNFDRTVIDAIKEADVDPACITLEITESTLIDNHEQTEDILNKLIVNKIRIAIDDFGTGFSNLAYLKYLPVSYMKIDKIFMRSFESILDKKLVLALINLAHGMNLLCVAEGVETEEQFAFLKEHKCDVVQGYLLAKPMPPNNLINLISGAKNES